MGLMYSWRSGHRLRRSLIEIWGNCNILGGICLGVGIGWRDGDLS